MSHSLTPTFGTCASGQIKAIVRGCLAEREFAMTELIPRIYADTLLLVVVRCCSLLLVVFSCFSPFFGGGFDEEFGAANAI